MCLTMNLDILSIVKHICREGTNKQHEARFNTRPGSPEEFIYTEVREGRPPARAFVSEARFYQAKTLFDNFPHLVNRSNFILGGGMYHASEGAKRQVQETLDLYGKIVL